MYDEYENYELYEHKRSDKVKWVISFILIFVLLAGLIGAWILLLKPEETPPEEPPTVTDEAGNELESGERYPLPNQLRFASTMAAADEGIKLTATIKPAYATDQSVDWTVTFVNASSEWAQGKTVTDYVTVTPESDGSTNATVKCLKEFGEQIKITVTSRSNPSAKAECTADYRRRLTGISVNLRYGLCNESMTWHPTYDYEYAFQENGAMFSFCPTDYDYLADYDFTSQHEIEAYTYGYGTGTLANENEGKLSATMVLRINPDFVTEYKRTHSSATFADLPLEQFFGQITDFYKMIGGVSPAKDKSAYDAIMSALKSYDGAVFEAEFTVTGTGVSETYKYGVDVDLDSLTVAVQSLTLGQGTIEF